MLYVPSSSQFKLGLATNFDVFPEDADDGNLEGDFINMAEGSSSLLTGKPK